MSFSVYQFFVDFQLLQKQKAEKLDVLPVDTINTIVIYSNTAIGDTLFNTPTIRALKTQSPDKKIIAIMNPTNYTLFENNPYIDEIILYNGKWKDFYKTLKTLKKYTIDLSIILHSNEPQATPMAVLSNSKYILKIPNNKTKYNIYHNNQSISPYKDKHGIFDRLRTLKYLNIISEDPHMDLFIEEDSKQKVYDYFEQKGINKKNDILIGFQIGASTVSRMWFEEKWIALANSLLNYYDNVKIVLTGSPNEKKLTNRVYSQVEQQNRVLDVAGEFPLVSAAAVIEKLDILITPDTGPMHMAIALQTPTIGLFVVAELIKSHACYDKEKHLFIKKEKTCEPCIAKRCKFQKCMDQIEVAEVMGEVEELLR